MRTSVAFALPLVLAACTDEMTDCPARGASTTFTGSVAYDGQDEGAQGAVAGALPETIVVYDATLNCTYEGMSFPIGIGDCMLWVNLTQASVDGGDGYVGTIEPGQTCALPVAGGTREVLLGTGFLSVGGLTQLTLSGDLVLEGGGTRSSGYLWWEFTGQ
jgi:hypothetical protein